MGKKAAFQKAAQEFTRHYLTSATSEIDLMTLDETPPEGGYDTRMAALDARIAAADRQAHMLDVVAPLLLDVSAKINTSEKYVIERSKLQGDLILDEPMKDMGARLIELLHQLKGLHGEQSPLNTQKKTITIKHIDKFQKSLREIFELSTPERIRA